MKLGTILSAILPMVFKTIDKHVPDTDAANAIRADLTAELLARDSEEMKQAASIIIAEAKGESWLQRSWRPVLMFVFIAIIAREYLISPMLFADHVPMDLREEFWTLLQLGVTGYIGGRSGEKIAAVVAERLRG